MAEKGTPRLARAPDIIGDELLLDELQRRVDQARDSISQTANEIKDTAVHRYEAVKGRVAETIEETLDWREQFRQRPVAWSLAAIGAGFITGYLIAAMLDAASDDDDHAEDKRDSAPATPRAYAGQPILGAAVRSNPRTEIHDPEKESRRGLFERFQETQAYDRLRGEASALGNRFADEVAQTAKEILLPAAVRIITDNILKITRGLISFFF